MCWAWPESPGLGLASEGSGLVKTQARPTPRAWAWLRLGSGLGQGFKYQMCQKLYCVFLQIFFNQGPACLIESFHVCELSSLHVFTTFPELHMVPSQQVLACHTFSGCEMKTSVHQNAYSYSISNVVMSIMSGIKVRSLTCAMISCSAATLTAALVQMHGKAVHLLTSPPSDFCDRKCDAWQIQPVVCNKYARRGIVHVSINDFLNSTFCYRLKNRGRTLTDIAVGAHYQDGLHL